MQRSLIRGRGKAIDSAWRDSRQAAPVPTDRSLLSRVCRSLTSGPALAFVYPLLQIQRLAVFIMAPSFMGNGSSILWHNT